LKKTDSQLTKDHPDDMLLPYLEGGLTSEERTAVREHLDTCRHCAAEADELKSVTGKLRSEKTIFCPSPGALFDYAGTGNDPDSEISEHLKECQSCRDEIEGYRLAAKAPEVMNNDLWRHVRSRVPVTVDERGAPSGESAPAGFWQRLFGRPYLAPMAAAAAAAVILIVVMMEPADLIQPFPGVSSETWEGAPRPKTAEVPGRKRAAVLILFKDFAKAPPQKMTDALYKALEPTLEISERYQIISPAELKPIVRKMRFSADHAQASLAGLRRALGVSVAALVTVTASGDRYDVTAELVDTETGRSIERRQETSLPLEKLVPAVRDLTRSLMLS